MELNDYQQKAMTTCTASSNNFSYMFCNLVGEIGEFASKVAKHIRLEEATIHHDKIYFEIDDDHECPVSKVELMKEAGDILWQLSGLCEVMGWDLESVAQTNLEKLADRAKRNKIVGDGDNR